MRLQSAIFSIEDTLAGHEEVGKVLSILKMEGVWLYAVTDMERRAAGQALAQCGVAELFRGILTAGEAGCAASDGKMFEKAMRRLRSERRDTIVFAGRLDALRAARAAGFRAAAVKGAADAREWAEMRAEADEIVERYGDFLS